MTLFNWNYLEEINMDYLDYLQFSLKNSLYLFCGSVLGVIHAFCPMILVTVQSDTVAHVDKLLKDKLVKKKD